MLLKKIRKCTDHHPPKLTKPLSSVLAVPHLHVFSFFTGGTHER